MDEAGSLFICFFFPGIFVKHILSAFFNQVNFLSLANGRIIEDTSGAFHLRRFEAFQIFVSCVFYGAPGSCDGWNLFCDGEIPGQGSGDFGEIKGGWLLAREVRCRQRTRLP